jgi:hypothetical protein
MSRFAHVVWIVGSLCICVSASCFAAGQEREGRGASHETIVLIRHGEKPPSGLGQLNCQGLNRSLALPAVLLAKFGKPDYLMAPDPAHLKRDGAGLYSYIRPLATIEPTAIALGMPVSTAYGFDEIDRLQDLLRGPDYRNALVIVAWEHKLAEQLARNILRQSGGAESEVPRWKGSDFDSMYVITIDRSANGTVVASFKHDWERLDGLIDTCPAGANSR